jgi:hypothetical protein
VAVLLVALGATQKEAIVAAGTTSVGALLLWLARRREPDAAS